MAQHWVLDWPSFGVCDLVRPPKYFESSFLADDVSGAKNIVCINRMRPSLSLETASIAPHKIDRREARTLGRRKTYIIILFLTRNISIFIIMTGCSSMNLKKNSIIIFL